MKSATEVVTAAGANAPGIPSQTSLQQAVSNIQSQLRQTGSSGDITAFAAQDQSSVFSTSWDNLKQAGTNDYFSSVMATNIAIDLTGSSLQFNDGSELSKPFVQPLSQVPIYNPRDQTETLAKRDLMADISQLKLSVSAATRGSLARRQIRRLTSPDPEIRNHAQSVKNSVTGFILTANSSETKFDFVLKCSQEVNHALHRRRFRSMLEEVTASVVADEIAQHNVGTSIQNYLARMGCVFPPDATLGIAQIRPSTAKEADTDGSLGVAGMSTVELAKRLASDADFSIKLVPHILATKYFRAFPNSLVQAIARYKGEEPNHQGQAGALAALDSSRLRQMRSLLGSTESNFEVLDTGAGANDDPRFGPNVNTSFDTVPFLEWAVKAEVHHTAQDQRLVDSVSLGGRRGIFLHCLQKTDYSDHVPNGMRAGRLRVVYQSGRSDSVDLVEGVNTADWQRQNPLKQGCMIHNAVLPGFTWTEQFADGSPFEGRHYYLSIPLREAVDRVELVIDSAPYIQTSFTGCSPADSFGITIRAMTIEK